MRTAGRLGWLEIKLLLREPVTVMFGLVLPLGFLFVLGGVFGNQAPAAGEKVVWQGVGAMSFYVPAYLVLVVMSVCVISIPTHLASNRERGVLRRYRASSVSPAAIAGAQLIVSTVMCVVSALVLLAAATIAYHYQAPRRPVLVAVVFLAIIVGSTATGVLLGAIIPNARAAQAIGLLLWFVMMLLGGAGPPEEALTGPMRAISNATPMRHAVRMIDQPWLGLDAGLAWLTFAAVASVSLALGLRFFRWE
jgi:ABC-2 type transport system permease protein